MKKNHKWVNGRLLQTNKNWSHLKQKQKEWIAQLLKDEYICFVETHKRKPNKVDKEDIVSKVYTKIEEREIWIPYYEVERYFTSRIRRYDHSLEKTSFPIETDAQKDGNTI